MDFNSVRADKEDDVRRYNRLRNPKTFVLIATLVSLLVLHFLWCSPWNPAAMDIHGELFRTIKSVLRQREYVFLLMNTLVLAIYFSNHKNADVSQLPLYDEYVSNSFAEANLHSPASEMKIAPDCSVSLNDREIRVAETGRLYRRSRWVRFQRRTVELRSELRRSEAESGGEMAVRRQSMEELSSEEFRIIVESFIAKKKMESREGTDRVTRTHILV